jgi:hypothetical protein
LSLKFFYFWKTTLIATYLYLLGISYIYHVLKRAFHGNCMYFTLNRAHCFARYLQFDKYPPYATSCEARHSTYYFCPGSLHTSRLDPLPGQRKPTNKPRTHKIFWERNHHKNQIRLRRESCTRKQFHTLSFVSIETTEQVSHQPSQSLCPVPAEKVELSDGRLDTCGNIYGDQFFLVRSDSTLINF